MDNDFEGLYEEMLQEQASMLFDKMIDAKADFVISELENILESDLDFDEILKDDEDYEYVEEDVLEESDLSAAERRKIGRKMHKGAASKKAQRTKKRKAKRTLKPEEIQAKAKKWARLQLKKQLMKELPQDASIADKKRVEKRIDSKSMQQKLARLEKIRFRQLRKVGGHGEKLAVGSKKKGEEKKATKKDDKKTVNGVVKGLQNKVKDFKSGS